jgi:hypothetical protein
LASDSFAIAAAIALRGDYDAPRLLALATIYDGGSRTQAAELAGVGLQAVRDWVLRFNAADATGW